MIPVNELDRLRLGAPLEHGRTAELEILNEDHAIAVGEHGAVGILHDAGALGNLLFRSLKSACDALPLVGMGNHFLHRAFGTGGMGHG